MDALDRSFPDVFEAKLVFPYVSSLQPLHKGCEGRFDDLVFIRLCADESWCFDCVSGLSSCLGHMMKIYEQYSSSDDLTKALHGIFSVGRFCHWELHYEFAVDIDNESDQVS